MDSGDVTRAKQQPTEELQRTEEYTKADNRLRPNLRPLALSAPALSDRSRVGPDGDRAHSVDQQVSTTDDLQPPLL